MSHLERLIDHLAWSNHAVIRSLRQSKIDSSIVEVFAHVLGAEHVWYSRLIAEKPTIMVWPKLTVEECERLADENIAALKSFVTSLDTEDYGRGVTYKNSAGDEFTSTIEDILLHVVLHGSYHRGQIAWALRHQGFVPSPTDFIAFTRGSPAATRRDAPPQFGSATP